MPRTWSELIPLGLQNEPVAQKDRKKRNLALYSPTAAAVLN